MRRACSILALASAVFAASAPARAFVWPSTVDRLERAFADQDAAVRRRAARELFELAPAVVKRLGSKALEDPDPDVRVAALEALFEARVRGLGRRVAPWLSDTDARVRRAAASALVKDPVPEAVPALGRVLSDPESAVRVAAARALGASGVRSATVPLLGRLDDSDPEVREAVIVALSRLGDAGAVVPLVGKIQDNRPSVRRALATALGELGDVRASSALVLLLRDNDETVRAAALGALGRIGAVDAVATIVALLEDERRPTVREAAFLALADIPSEAGLDALVAALSRDDPREKSPVRAALVRAGARAVPKLAACLQGQPSFDQADGCALALGEMHADSAVETVDAALRRGIVRPQAALRALGAAGDPRGLVTVLAHLGAEDPWVRRVAIEAATSLLDPSAPDGRAVDPILRALDSAHGRRPERNALVTLLGRTGSPEAGPVLGMLARDVTDGALRLAAIQSLGSIGRAGQGDVLVSALSDEQPSIRLAAALSLRKVGGASSAEVLPSLLEVAAEQDRTAIGLALPGPFSVLRSTEPADRKVVERAVALANRASVPTRDALVEALGAVPGRLGSDALASLLPGGDAELRAKVAESLAAHREALGTLRALLHDADAAVRANAVWSLGEVGAASDVPAVRGLLSDEDTAVRGNATATLARLAVRGAATTGLLCALADDERTYVRENALSGLRATRTRCEGAVEREILVRDPSETVRAAAARLIASVPGTDSAGDRAALAHSATDDPSPVVAKAAKEPASRPPSGAPAFVTVFVVPDGRTEPFPRSPFALRRADGLVRLGVADARGAVTEPLAPPGTMRLEIPAPLVP